MLITKDTVDEVYYHVARNKENRMYRTIKEMNTNHNESIAQKENNHNSPKTLMDFKEDSREEQQQKDNMKLKIIADYREKGSNVLKELIDKVSLNLEKLDIGDFLLSSRVIVEYKTVQDFVDSILDGRLLSQLKQLKQYERPLIIVEGTEDIYSARKVHPNSIRGMIATITVSYGIPLIQTKTSRDTAEYLIAIAKREQDETKAEVQYHYGKPMSTKEQQEYFISALPNIGMGGARPLLKHFKNVKNIVNASEDELKEVDLIGPKKSKALKDIFDEEWKE